MDVDTPLQRRLILPADDSADSDIHTNEFYLNRDSSLVALALVLDLPLFGDGFTKNNSGVNVSVGNGAFAAIDLSRLSRGISGQLSWYGEEDRVGPARPLGQKVAMKHVFRYVEDGHSRAVADLAKEMRILGHDFLRDHENIVDVIGLTWDGDFHDRIESTQRRPVLLLEYAGCGNLEDFFSLANISFSWVVKMDILTDILNGLEAIDDAGVTHGDLKLANVLVFRVDEDKFQAKICDFGSAVIGVDLNEDEPVSLTVCTPPWDAPEALNGIDQDLSYKIDMYCFGLLACRVILEGGDPFELWLQEHPLPPTSNKRTIVAEWKKDDGVLDICKHAIRNKSNIFYSTEQLLIIDRLMELTIRTDIDSRADEFSEILAVLGVDQAKRQNRYALKSHD
jgi:serine/threonine protein kinase